jgi:hypothetical protein
MKESFSITCHWGARQQNTEELAMLIEQTLKELRLINSEYFGRWFKKGYSVKEALQEELELSYSYILPLVKKAKNKQFEDLGIVEGFWNGLLDIKASDITFRCGSFSKRVGNSIVLQLPYDDIANQQIVRYNVALKLLSIFVKVWNPDKLQVRSNLDYDVINYSTRFLEVGWLTYFSESFQDSNIEAHPPFDDHIEGYGDILSVTKDSFSLKNEEHIKMLQEYVDKVIFKEP